MLRVGLTGGIGSGKSTVSRLLVARGALVVDADLIAREVVAPGSPGLAAVLQEFGPAVRHADGSLDRAALARTVFADPERRAALNAIVHPLVRARSDEIAAAAPSDAVLVHDVPLLVESGLAPAYDIVVVVDVPADVALDRLVEQRGMTADEARDRMRAQASREQRLAAAHVVLDNSGSPAQLAAQVDALWVRLSAGSAVAAPRSQA